MARLDLHNLRVYMSKDSPENARRFLKKIRLMATNLHEFPEKLPVVPELGLPYRERLVGRYRVIYKIEEGRRARRRA